MNEARHVAVVIRKFRNDTFEAKCLHRGSREECIAFMKDKPALSFGGYGVHDAHRYVITEDTWDTSPWSQRADWNPREG